MNMDEWAKYLHDLPNEALKRGGEGNEEFSRMCNEESPVALDLRVAFWRHMVNLQHKKGNKNLEKLARRECMECYKRGFV